MCHCGPIPAQALFVNITTEHEDSSLKKTTRPSMLNLVVPAIVSSRIPAIPSLRRSILDLRGRSVQTRPVERIEEGKEEEATETEAQPQAQPTTPPPDYTSQLRCGLYEDENSETLVNSDAEENGTQIEGQGDASRGSSRPSTRASTRSNSPRPSSSRTAPPQFPLNEIETGIKWKYANQGTLSLHLQDRRSKLTKSRYQPPSHVIRRIQRTSPQPRRRIGKFNTATLPAQHDIPTTRSTGRPHTGRAPIPKRSNTTLPHQTPSKSQRTRP